MAVGSPPGNGGTHLTKPCGLQQAADGAGGRGAGVCAAGDGGSTAGEGALPAPAPAGTGSLGTGVCAVPGQGGCCAPVQCRVQRQGPCPGVTWLSQPRGRAQKASLLSIDLRERDTLSKMQHHFLPQPCWHQAPSLRHGLACQGQLERQLPLMPVCCGEEGREPFPWFGGETSGEPQDTALEHVLQRDTRTEDLLLCALFPISTLLSPSQCPSTSFPLSLFPALHPFSSLPLSHYPVFSLCPSVLVAAQFSSLYPTARPSDFGFLSFRSAPHPYFSVPTRLYPHLPFTLPTPSSIPCPYFILSIPLFVSPSLFLSWYPPSTLGPRVLTPPVFLTPPCLP